MVDGSEIIKSVCSMLLSEGDFGAAKAELINKWPFQPFEDRPKRGSIPPRLALEVFFRDNFTCRYCGKRTIYLGMLRLMTLLLPNEFPCHPNWKWSETHPAYWVISSSCDHLIPAARGGLTNKENLVTSCYMCNSIKANWTTEELGWTLKEPSTGKWDGLISLFVEIMESKNIQDQSLINLCNLIKSK